MISLCYFQLLFLQFLVTDPQTYVHVTPLLRATKSNILFQIAII